MKNILFVDKRTGIGLMRKIKVLFVIHDLGPGGAEKVLVNLVNNMNRDQFDITVMSIFDEGINKQFLASNIRYCYCFRKAIRGNSHIMKFFSPQWLHSRLIKGHYDIEIAYLEGPCARVVSGCSDRNTKLISWIHIEQHSAKSAADSFRNVKEAEKCYNRFNQIICVSQTVKDAFTKSLNIHVPVDVYYNTNESGKIIKSASDHVDRTLFSGEEFKLVCVGKLLKNKGFDRVLRIVKKLREEEYPVHLYILGLGPEETYLREYIEENGLVPYVTLLGYQTNPYKYVSRCDLFICSSYSEGFSTAATEALIVGTPVCTVNVSGMQEMLGENSEYGLITDNNDQALYRGIKKLIDHPDLLKYYRTQAEVRKKIFSTKDTVKAVEKLLNDIVNI